MARCDCAGSKCTCALNAGPGVTITGSGDAGNPYFISAERQDISGQLTVSDTSTLDLARSGEGTLNEPYNINGVVKIGPLLQAGDGITLTGAGTVADPYVIVGEAEAITGLLTAGTNITITGNGTTTSPYVINSNVTGLTNAGTNVTRTGSGTSASPYVFAANVTGLVNPGGNMTRSGAGTAASPYVLSSNAIGLVTAGSNITITGNGTSTTPYVITAAAAPPASEITGLVSAGTNIQMTGQGTTAAPYVISSVHTLDSLSDVTITTPANGQVLRWNGTEWVNSTFSLNLDGLSDVTITSPVANQILVRDPAGTGQWINGAIGLNQLTDVVVSSGTPPTAGQILQYSTVANAFTVVDPPYVPQNPEQRSQYLLSGTVNWSPGTIAVGAQSSTPITVTGVTLAENWIFHVAGGGALVGTHAWANVTANDTVTLYVSNMTANPVNYSTRTWNVYGWR